MNLDEFGKTLIQETRDRTIRLVDKKICGKMKDAESQLLFDKIQQLNNPKAEQIIKDLVPMVTDLCIHNILCMVEDSDDISILYDGEDISETSDGLAGELYTEDGWIEKYSSQRLKQLQRENHFGDNISARGIKMQIVYKRLTSAELDTFINMRIAQLTEEYLTLGRKVPEDVDMKSALKDYYRRHMQEGTFVSWIAVDEDKIIGTSGMSFVEKPPYFDCPTGRLGLLSSMYTDPDYRRMGIARELLNRVVEEAKSYGCGAVHITASDMGVKLYSAYGFKHNGNFMQYTF